MNISRHKFKQQTGDQNALSPSHLNVIVLGIGKIGNRVLTKLQQESFGYAEMGISIGLAAYANRKEAWFHQPKSQQNHFVSRFLESRNAKDFEFFLNTIKADYQGFHVIADCTACDAIVTHYSTMCSLGYHVVAANKRANVMPYQDYQALHRDFSQQNKRFLYSANVGAGLPILSTIRNLKNSGDCPVRVCAILSGTLGYIFSNLKENLPFSKVLEDAVKLGLTEPDVREDLSGLDVARKALIIAREMGIVANMEDISLEAIANLHEPLDLAFLDKYYAERWVLSEKKQRVLRYVADISRDGIRVGLMETQRDSPLGFCSHTDNIALLYTKNHDIRPIIIQGAGAGVDVTATAVISDILQIASSANT